MFRRSSLKVMFRTAFRFTPLLLLLSLAACVTKDGQPISRNQRVFQDHPIAVRLQSKYIDEDSPLEYTLRFRNAGSEIASFDYTVADQPNVPHIDRDGPDSGLISNLYPGSEVEVANPKKKKHVWVTLGTVTYGKKAPTELDAVYRPNAVVAAEQSTVLAPQ